MIEDKNIGKWFTALSGGDDRMFFKFEKFVEDEEAIYVSEIVFNNRYYVNNEEYGMEELDEIEEVSLEKVRINISSFDEKAKFQKMNPEAPMGAELYGKSIPADTLLLKTDGYKIHHGDIIPVDWNTGAVTPEPKTVMATQPKPLI